MRSSRTTRCSASSAANEPSSKLAKVKLRSIAVTARNGVRVSRNEITRPGARVFTRKNCPSQLWQERNLSPPKPLTRGVHARSAQMAKQNPNKNQQNQQRGQQSRPVGNYNPGGQAGESVRGGGQRPAD